VALAPFDAAEASRLLSSLKLAPLLDGPRGTPALDREAFCQAAARFSALVASLDGTFSAIDVNPVLVQPQGCLAVDALVLPVT